MATMSLIVLIAGSLQCSRPFDCNNQFDSTGGIVVWVLVMAYMCKVLGTVCDDYFVPAIDEIVDRLRLSPDIAGATFLAAGSSAPELATNLVATFLIVGEGGIGTIIGSAIFNILVIIGITSWVACREEHLKIWWYPLSRDCAFYMLAIVELLVFVRDSRVEWWEAALMVSTYGLYVAYMVLNPRIVTGLQLNPASSVDATKASTSTAASSGDVALDPEEGEVADTEASRGETVASSAPTAAATWESRSESTATGSNDIEEPQPPGEQPPATTPKRRRSRCRPRDPLAALFRCALPSAEKHCWALFCLCTFLISVGSYVMVDATERVGQILTIDQMVMGLVFLAAGTSIPDALGSIAVAKQGEGDMAVANALGSNVFDILLGLGLPWLLYTASTGEPLTFEQAAYDRFKYDVWILVIVLWVFIGLLVANRWKLTRLLGGVLLLVYALYVVYALVLRPCALRALHLPTITQCAIA
mmetsp:Transcript_41419/g.119232  ORF Transcript_41419/g.119232 Transcript_41419/m.119232 type:complete len:474 (+) Transcript_41419:124-1545(+)